VAEVSSEPLICLISVSKITLVLPGKKHVLTSLPCS
jgi:hypothetical protein